ncbi:MAG: heme exporter protein CcmD [Pseudomonadota bacterium]
MFDMEKYAGAVLSSYAASLILLALLILVTLRRGRRARRALEAVEQKRRDNA